MVELLLFSLLIVSVIYFCLSKFKFIFVLILFVGIMYLWLNHNFLNIYDFMYYIRNLYSNIFNNNSNNKFKNIFKTMTNKNIFDDKINIDKQQNYNKNTINLNSGYYNTIIPLNLFFEDLQTIINIVPALNNIDNYSFNNNYAGDDNNYVKKQLELAGNIFPKILEYKYIFQKIYENINNNNNSIETIKFINENLVKTWLIMLLIIDKIILIDKTKDDKIYNKQIYMDILNLQIKLNEQLKLLNIDIIEHICINIMENNIAINNFLIKKIQLDTNDNNYNIYTSPTLFNLNSVLPANL